MSANRNRTAGLVWLLLFGASCGRAEQGPNCSAFVECVQQLDALRGATTDVARFEPGGACWKGDKGAEVCERSCARGLPRLESQQPELTCTMPR
jgi:hypothetical protein